jgi:membrane-bound ClpP family serine protease
MSGKSENTPNRFAKLNSFLTAVDMIVGWFGFWYKIIFLLAFPTIVMYSPVKFISSGIIEKFSIKMLSANPYVLSLTLIGIFFIILYFIPKVATVLEFILCTFYVLLKGFGISDFVVYQFSSLAGTATTLGEKIGVVLCAVLLAGKIFFLIYKILKSYRRKNMTREYDSSGYFSQKFYEASKVVMPEDNQEQGSVVVDGDGFITSGSQNKMERTMPDLSGFIVGEEEQ